MLNTVIINLIQMLRFFCLFFQKAALFQQLCEHRFKTIKSNQCDIQRDKLDEQHIRTPLSLMSPCSNLSG